MALLDFLKRKKQIEKAKPAFANASADKMAGEAKKPGKKTEAVEFQEKSGGHRVSAGFSYSIIKEPHISEKATDLANKENQYTFKVQNNSNKTEIKKAVEGIYGVSVLSVNIISIPKKKRRLGRTQGYRKGFVKAVVKVREGEKIEIL